MAECIARKHPHGRGEDGVAASGGGGQEETPPRAWGRHQHLVVRKNLTTRCSKNYKYYLSIILVLE